MDSVMIIVEVVVGNEIFSIFVVVVKVVDLVEVLFVEGFFIVFVFINDVFVVLFVGMVESLLLFENKDKLVKILIYYVVFGKIIVV